MVVLRKLQLIGRWWKTWGTLPVLSWVRAAAQYKSGRFNSAAKNYQKGLARHPNHPASHCARMDLAYCLFRGKQLEEAEAQLKHVTTHLPHSREAHIRLARLQLWMGRSLDAAWTMRRALRFAPKDTEIVALFMFAVIDNGGPSFLLREAIRASVKTADSDHDRLLLEACKAQISYMRKERLKSREVLERVAGSANASVEILILVAEMLIKEREVASARRHLRRALMASPDHPRVLSLLAESYLVSGPFYNSEFAIQLATDACKYTNWLSPREMHVLAEAYYHLDDRISALIVASKARDEGTRLLGTYRDAANLEKLIESLSSGTQA